MTTRRDFLAAGAAFASFAGSPALASSTEFPPLKRRFRPRMVRVNKALDVGMIYVDSDNYYLYHIRETGRAMRYGVSLGEDGRKFKGFATISRKAKWPSWRPTANMIRLEPDVYGPYAAGLPGGHEMNPMGSRALYLDVDGQPTYYRIHGTHMPETIGTSFSSGCIRLRNDHIDALYDEVPVGTKVHAF